MYSTLILRLSLLGTSAFLGLLLALALLFLKKGNSKANFLLVIIILVYTGSSINSFLMFSGLYQTYPHLILITYPFKFLLGFLFYLYIQYLVNPAYKLRWYHSFHLIPLFYVCYQLQWFYPMIAATKISTLTTIWFQNNEFTPLQVFHNAQPSLITLGYLVYIIHFLKGYIQKIKVQFSNTKVEYLNWLLYFTYVYTSLILAELMRLCLTYYFKWNPAENEIIINLLTTLFIQYIIYQSIAHPEKLFFKTITLLPQEEEKIITSLIKETRQPSPSHQLFIRRLTTYMDTEKPYLQPNLKIHELANQLQVSAHFLSKVINQELGINFYSFINNYRIEAFKEQAINQKNHNLTLTGIALNVGFNSKASFNRIFKKHTNLTPSAYIQQKTVSTSKTKPS